MRLRVVGRLDAGRDGVGELLLETSRGIRIWRIRDREGAKHPAFLEQVRAPRRGRVGIQRAEHLVDGGQGVTWWTDAWALFTKNAAIWVVLGLILFIIIVLSHPFKGYGRVSPEPFVHLLVRLRALTP